MREGTDSQGIQEIQYHEVIDNASSMLELLERIEADLREKSEFSLEGLSNQATLEEVLESSFKGDVKRFTSDLVTQYHKFCDEVAKKTQAHPRVNGEIGDIAFNDEGELSNVLVTGYDTKVARFQFTIIDPTEIQSLIPNRALSKGDGSTLNSKLETGDQRNLIYNKLHLQRPLSLINNSDWKIKQPMNYPILSSKLQS